MWLLVREHLKIVTGVERKIYLFVFFISSPCTALTIGPGTLGLPTGSDPEVLILAES